MNRSSSRKVKLTSKFEEFKLTANGKKRGRPRKSWPQDVPVVNSRPSMPVTREELFRHREENNTQTITSTTTIAQTNSTPTVKTPAVKTISSRKEELLRLREENANLKRQLEQMDAEFAELKRQTSYTGQTVPKIDFDDLNDKYHRELVYAKRREWCVVCLNPSRYYCCWNTTYCSQKCQVSDWYARHGRSCERTKGLQENISKKKVYE